MTTPVKRPYENAARRARSDATRRQILDVALRSFVEHGYRGATVAAIARSAGVHVDTIYALVGRKPALLTELVERSIAGGDRAVAPPDRAYVQAMRAEPDPVQKLAIYAAATADIHERMAPLLGVLRDAAGTDDEARQVWHTISDRRARNMRDLVRDLGPVGTLRSGTTVDEAADIVWATAAPELYLLLTQERGWSRTAYVDWLGDAWVRLLLA